MRIHFMVLWYSCTYITFSKCFNFFWLRQLHKIFYLKKYFFIFLTNEIKHAYYVLHESFLSWALGRRMPRHKFSFTFLIQSYFQLLFILRVDFFVSAYSREKIELFSERWFVLRYSHIMASFILRFAFANNIIYLPKQSVLM